MTFPTNLRKAARVAFLFGAAILVATSAYAGTIVIDEFGVGFINGVRITGTVSTDPGPGGLAGVLTYALPFTGVQGDVNILEATGGLTLDVIRFNGNGTVLFYSDNIDGADARADTSSPPSSRYTNLVTVTEVGTETFNYVDYTPGPNQPGYNSTFLPTYRFISDGSAVPEPGTLLLVAAGLALVMVRTRRPQ